MNAKQSLVILISNENYLRNWIQAGAFSKLADAYNVHYVVAKDYWDPERIKDFGVEKFDIVSQSSYRKFFLRRLLTVTMFKHFKKSPAFEVKLRYIKPHLQWLYKFLASPIVFDVFLAFIKILLPKWGEFSRILRSHKPTAVIAPSLAGDSFTIDMTYTAKAMGVKSILLINSWDNLVSKGVLPMPPDCLVVWGDQGKSQAISIQGVPADRIKTLGLARFEPYFKEIGLENKWFIHEFNGIPKDKKIILYAATALPFDDMSVLEVLDTEISLNSDLCDYVILFRPHPEMMKRVSERDFNDCDFKNVFIDRQVGNFYRSRFQAASDDFPSFINNAALEYYPLLLKSVSCVVCPPTTLALEGALNGSPCLVIGYSDGKNTKLSPDQICKYGFMSDLLAMPGVIPCFREDSLQESFKNLIEISLNSEARSTLVNSTRGIVYRDDIPYAGRLLKLVHEIVSDNPV